MQRKYNSKVLVQQKSLKSFYKICAKHPITVGKESTRDDIWKRVFTYLSVCCNFLANQFLETLEKTYIWYCISFIHSTHKTVLYTRPMDNARTNGRSINLIKVTILTNTIYKNSLFDKYSTFAYVCSVPFDLRLSKKYL